MPAIKLKLNEMHNVLHQAVNLNNGLVDLHSQETGGRLQETREHIFALIISIGRCRLSVERNARNGHMYRALVCLDRIEFDLRSMDGFEWARDIESILREISLLRREINAFICET